MHDVERWVADSPYGRAMGPECESVARDRCVLVLPYCEGNANPGGVLHAGAAASLCAAAALCVARVVGGSNVLARGTVVYRIVAP